MSVFHVVELKQVKLFRIMHLQSHIMILIMAQDQCHGIMVFPKQQISLISSKGAARFIREANHHPLIVHKLKHLVEEQEQLGFNMEMKDRQQLTK
jgi:hypothetical protein